MYQQLQTYILEYSPVLLVASKLYVTQHKYLFIIGVIMTIILNTVLKNIIKEPRPEPTEGTKYGELQEYGMPSGHAQLAAFSLLFDAPATYSERNTHIYYMMVILLIATLYHRNYSNYHSVPQLFAGTLAGAFSALLINATCCAS
jgi:membrane-associated phospholipid phosphatase